MKGRENMTKQEVIELVKSGRLRGFLTPEAARYAINIEEMGTYTGIVLVNPDMKEAAYPFLILTGQWKDCSISILRKKQQRYLQEQLTDFCRPHQRAATLILMA